VFFFFDQIENNFITFHSGILGLPAGYTGWQN
jgi:hypothetical protein